jgi:hypothetical protein
VGTAVSEVSGIGERERKCVGGSLAFSLGNWVHQNKDSTPTSG